MLGSTSTCIPTDPLPVIDNWNAAAIFDSLILTCTPPSGQAVYSVHAVITTGNSGQRKTADFNLLSMLNIFLVIVP